MGFNQRDRRWAAHALGFGPALGTIGDYGCVLTTDASIARLAGVDTDPARLDEAYVRHGSIFERDPTGTFDFLPDGALAKLMPNRFQWRGSYAGLRSDLIDHFLPTPDVYIELHISTASVPTHRVYVWSGRSSKYQIDDAWGPRGSRASVVHALADYGGAAAVAKTILVRALTPAPKPAFHPKPQPAHPPAPTPPEPSIPDEPQEPYGFIVRAGDVEADLAPPTQVTYLSCAQTLANDWVRDQPAGTVLEVVDADGRPVYQASGASMPVTD